MRGLFSSAFPVVVLALVGASDALHASPSLVTHRGTLSLASRRVPSYTNVASRMASPVASGAAVKKTRSTPWKTLLKLCKPDVPLLSVAFVSLTIAASGDALLPALQGAALNTALGLETQAHASLRSALVNLVGVGIGTAVFTGVRGFAFWLCGARLVARLRATLFEALLEQPQAFHDSQGPGELSSRLATDCIKLGDVLSLNINIVLRQVIQSLAGIAVVTRLNGRLAALVLLGVALRSTFAHFYSRATRRIAVAQQDVLAGSSGVAEQCLSLIKVVRSHGNEANERARYGGKLDELLALQTRAGALYGASRVFNGAVDAMMTVGILALGAAFVASGLLAKEVKGRLRYLRLPTAPDAHARVRRPCVNAHAHVRCPCVNVHARVRCPRPRPGPSHTRRPSPRSSCTSHSSQPPRATWPTSGRACRRRSALPRK